MRKVVMLIMAIVLSISHLLAQERTVTGKVTDEKGFSIPNVSVTIKGTKTGTTTKPDGSFSLTVPANANTLVFSFVDMITQELAIGTESTINVSMKADETSLQEVVVTGYETKRKRDIAGATGSIKGGDIASRPVGSFARAMQGQIAGVQVVSNNGVPGGNVTVRIRGLGTVNASNTPLYIVDGVQLVTGNSNSLSTGNGPEGPLSSNLLNSLNPDDIETIDVLKDPASASIYGAQAANGVVIITTKRGKQGKTKVNFNTYWGISKIIKELDVLTATEAVQLGYEAYANRYGANASQTTTFLTSMNATVKNNVVDPLPDNDWQSLAFRNGFVQNYDLSASGGNEKTTFFVSGGYNKLDGHVVASDFQRGSFRINLDHRINTRFSIGTALTLSTFTQNGVLNGGSFGNPVRSSFLAFPTNTPYMPDGSLRSASKGTWFGGIDNFLTYTDYDITFSNVKNLIGGFNLTYNITPHISFRSSFNMNWNYTEEKQFNDPRYSGAPLGSVSKFSTQIRDFQTNQVFNYNQRFDRHVVSGLLGGEYRNNLNTSFGAFGQGIPLPQFQTLSSTATPNQPSEGYTSVKLVGMFAKIGYTYNDRYILNFTVRRDGSSRFGANTKYGTFPAISAAWRLSEENFFGEEFRRNNEIKLRLSYGVTGNQAGIGAYASRALFGLSGEYLSLSGGAPSQLGQDDLSWEENESYNIGLDAKFFNRRIEMEIDAFHSNRNRLLLDVPLPNTSGFSSITQNVGKLRNRGIEIQLNTVNIKSPDFRWTSNLNFTYIKNKVMGLAPGQTQIGTGIKIGLPLNSIFTYKYAGVNPADGRPMYYDTLGNLTYITQLRDRYYLDGTLDPTFFGGFTNTFSYKNFELKVQLQYQGGNYIQNSDAAFVQRAGSTVDRNQIKSQLQRWQKPGDITTVPKPYFGGTQPGALSNSNTADRFFEKGDYARIKEVTISYNFPKSILNRLKIVNAAFYVSGLNLYTWSNYSMLDPELQGFDFGTYPQAKQVTFGLNISF
jgi:TonB-dependent starch-binding outer membrane protein SusC